MHEFLEANSNSSTQNEAGLNFTCLRVVGGLQTGLAALAETQPLPELSE